jgi:hypothetical protein
MWAVGTTILSDTILMRAEDSWDGAQTLVTACAHLLDSSLSQDWPLRGALAYGDCALAGCGKRVCHFGIDFTGAISYRGATSIAERLMRGTEREQETMFSTISSPC